MTADMVYSNLVDDRAALRRAGLLAAIQYQVALLIDRRRQAVLRKAVGQSRRDAAYVRRLAHLTRASNPGLAADLDAAVDRQEIENGIGL